MANSQINNGQNQQNSYYVNLRNKAHKRFLDRFLKRNIGRYIYGNNQIMYKSFESVNFVVVLLYYFNNTRLKCGKVNNKDTS